MDTQTVLDIIVIVDRYRDRAHNEVNQSLDEKGLCTNPYAMGIYDTMSMLSDELQECIEGQLNAHESTLGRGE